MRSNVQADLLGRPEGRRRYPRLPTIHLQDLNPRRLLSQGPREDEVYYYFFRHQSHRRPVAYPATEQVAFNLTAAYNK